MTAVKFSIPAAPRTDPGAVRARPRSSAFKVSGEGVDLQGARKRDANRRRTLLVALPARRTQVTPRRGVAWRQRERRVDVSLHQ